MKRKIIKILCILLAIICFVISGYFIYKEYSRSKMAPSVQELVKKKKKENYKDKNKNIKKEDEYVNKLPSYREEYHNWDIMGKLEIPNMNIDTLVTRTVNNEYYLYYSLSHQYDHIGVPFFDYRNTDLVNNKQINIYGHNTRNENYFDRMALINLEAYTDKNIFDNYKNMYLSIDEKQVHYRIVAIKIVQNNDNEHMKNIFYSNEDYIKHINKLLQNTLYKEDNLVIEKDDRIIVLQICHYNPENSYLLVIGKEIK